MVGPKGGPSHRGPPPKYATVLIPNSMSFDAVSKFAKSVCLSLEFDSSSFVGQNVCKMWYRIYCIPYSEHAMKRKQNSTIECR